MTDYVLDTSAVLTYFWQEPGWERAAEVLTGQSHAISSVNLAELVGKARREGMPESALWEMLTALELDVRGFDTDQALTCGLLLPLTRSAGLSLGDRACLALAKSLDAVAVTADRPWVNLDIGVRVECLRPAMG